MLSPPITKITILPITERIAPIEVFITYNVDEKYLEISFL